MTVAAQLVAKCLAVRTAAHYAHFKSRSYARHVALGDFYDDLLDAVDEFAEVYMGVEGRLESFPSAPEVVAARKGRKQSAETRAKRAESMRRAWAARKAAQDE